MIVATFRCNVATLSYRRRKSRNFYVKCDVTLATIVLGRHLFRRRSRCPLRRSVVRPRGVWEHTFYSINFVSIFATVVLVSLREAAGGYAALTVATVVAASPPLSQPKNSPRRVTLNLQDLTLQDWNWTDQLTGVEIAGLESHGPTVRGGIGRTGNLSVYISV